MTKPMIDPLQDPKQRNYWNVAPGRKRQLIFRLTKDPADEAYWAVVDVSRDLMRKVTLQQDFAALAGNVLNNLADVTVRYGMAYEVLNDIESFLDTDSSPGLACHEKFLQGLFKTGAEWLPIGFPLQQVVALSTSQTKLSLCGIQTWKDSVRFTSYAKHDESGTRLESVEDLREFFLKF